VAFGASSRARRAVRGLLWTAAVAVIVTALKIVFAPYIGPPTPFLLFAAVAAVGAWFGGWPGGLLTSVVTTLVGMYLFLPPYGHLPPANRYTAARLATYVVDALVVTGLTAWLRKERTRATATGAELEAVLAAVDDGIVVQQSDGRITYANDAAARLAGFSSAEQMIAGGSTAITSRYEILDPDGSPLDLNELPGRRALRGLPAPARLVCIRSRETDAETFASIRSRLVQGNDPRGRLERFVVNVYHDETEARRHEEALRVREEWFATTLRSIGDAVIATAPRGAVKFMNPIAERLTGWTSAEAQGRPLGEVFRIVNELTRQPVESPVERVLREGRVVGLANHTVLRTRAGGEVAIDDSAAPIRAATGEIAGTVLIFRDISERRADDLRRAFIAQATSELAASFEYERTLTTLVRLAVPTIADWCAIDMLEKGRLRRLAVQHVDPRKVELVYEIERRYPYDPETDAGAWAVVRTGRPVFIPEIPKGMMEASARDAEHRALILRLALRSYLAVPLIANGATIGVLTLAMAESGRRHGQRDLELAVALADRAALAVDHARLYEDALKARAEAERASRSKDEFLAVLGHELRNPLAPILTALQLMRRKAPNVLEREQAILERQVKHVTRLIDDMLDVSRITSGKIELARENVELAVIVARALEATWPLLEERHHSVTTDVSGDLIVFGDPERLVQVATNLISNAAKYTPPGGRIEISAACARDVVTLRVADNGVGLDPEILPRVFDLFVQGAQSLDRSRGGLGLGLAIVRSVVELHGGHAYAESAGPGRGSTFRVELPAARGEPAIHRPEPAAAPSHGEKVLVVDDNADALDLMAEALTELGQEPVTALDPATALARAKLTHPAIALIDIGLPVMDGYELARRLRQMPELAGCKLVAVTGYGQSADKARAREAGFDEHLVKPVTIEQVMAVIEKLTKSRKRNSGK
jgi:PAS domain S-box-containing protein